jgi:hypothetical protein
LEHLFWCCFHADLLFVFGILCGSRFMIGGRELLSDPAQALDAATTLRFHVAAHCFVAACQHNPAPPGSQGAARARRALHPSGQSSLRWTERQI